MPLYSKYRIILLLTLFLGGASWSCTQQSEFSPPQKPREEKTELVIAAMGDIMMHLSNQLAVHRNNGRYTILFEKIARDLTSADVVFANLETPIDQTARISGYPRFNAGPGLLATLKSTGVGIVSIANNHALDARPDGLKRTIDNIAAAGLLFTGGGRTLAEAGRPATVTSHGITAAFLAYTYGTNQRMPVKKKNDPRVNILRADSEADLARAAMDVKKARQSADLVVVSLHWGAEYRTIPTAWQRRAAAELIGAGADIILGHHPHVLQPIESYTAANGRQGLIAFSLGNFISSQNYGIAYKTRTHRKALRGDGIILRICAVKEQGKTSVTRVEFVPLWTLRERVGKNVVYRPVNLAREIARLEALPKRTGADEDTLGLLKFRMQAIIDELTAKKAL
jgi:poly-gamma-glutamate capsule biosynthesis protein CapA/YwtB (metallophosphatase superfamily)